MADTPTNPQPTTRKRLWSQEVKEADPTPEDKTAYEWSNGRTFNDGKGAYSPG